MALPDCKIAFHWPRTDFDQLLCVQMDRPGCHWSGGFFIDKVSSFHINMRYVKIGLDYVLYISFKPVLHDWCNKGRGICYPVCRMVHIKEPLLLIKKSSPCGGSRFPLSLSEWSITICLMPYNRK